MHRRAKGYKGSADHLLLRAYICVLQNKSNQGCTQGSKYYKASPTNCCCENTHVCCRLFHLRVATKDRVCPTSCCYPKDRHVACYKGPADRVLLQACTCVLQKSKTEGFTQGSTVTKVSRTTCCGGHAYVCCRINQWRVAPSQGLRRFARPTVAVSTHMCVAEYVSSRLHPWVRVYKGLAGRVLLRGHGRPIAAVSIHMCVAECVISGLHPRVERFQGFGRPGAAASIHTRAADDKMIKLKISPKDQRSTVTKVWPTTCCCGHTHVCCSINQRGVAPRVKVYEGLADLTLLGAHTCMCCRTDEFRNSGLHRRVKRYQGLADRPVVAVAVAARTRTCAFQNAAPNIQGLQGFHRPRCCCEHTPVCC